MRSEHFSVQLGIPMPSRELGPDPFPSLPAESFPPVSAFPESLPPESVPPVSVPPESQLPESQAPEFQSPEPVDGKESAKPVESVPVSPSPSASFDPASVPFGAWIGLGAALAAAVIGTAFFLGRKKHRKQDIMTSQTPQRVITEQPITEAPSSPASKPAAHSGSKMSPNPVTEMTSTPITEMTASAPAAKPKAAAKPAPGTVRVGKLHQQGARSSQQDCFSVSPEDLVLSHGLLAVVADGMGGLSDGDKVSQTVVSTMLNNFFLVQGEPDDILLTLLEQANYQVNCLLGPDGYSKSGSTLVAGLVRNGKFHYLSVGDSRICLYRDGALYQLNREHIFRHELELRAVNREEQLAAAAAHPKAAGLTSYLGMGRLKYVDMPAQPVAIRPGDRFILMSDGVYNALTQEELTACLDGTPDDAAQALNQAIRAKNYSNQDNYTAVILGF